MLPSKILTNSSNIEFTHAKFLAGFCKCIIRDLKCLHKAPRKGQPQQHYVFTRAKSTLLLELARCHQQYRMVSVQLIFIKVYQVNFCKQNPTKIQYSFRTNKMLEFVFNTVGFIRGPSVGGPALPIVFTRKISSPTSPDIAVSKARFALSTAKSRLHVVWLPPYHVNVIIVLNVHSKQHIIARDLAF